MFKKNKKTILILLTLLSLFFLTLYIQRIIKFVKTHYTVSERKTISKLEMVLDDAYENHYFHGCVLVAQKGKILFNRSYGYADFENKDTLNTNSIFQLASVSKQFTAMGIMILKAKGKLSYSDSVHQYIPEFPYKDVTIRHLLNHTSGLPNYIWQVDRFCEKNDFPYNDDAIRILNRERLYLSSYTGEKFKYSNTGYVLLASIIEKISKMRYDEFMMKKIFRPLKMKNTFVYSPALQDSAKRKIIPGYRHYSRGYRKLPMTKFDGIVGDKGIYSTTGDLFKWDQALYNEKLVDDEILIEAFQNGRLNNGEKVKYGFGFRIKKDDFGNRLIYHNGLWEGFRTSIVRNIKDEKTIIILEHTNCRYKHRLLKKIEMIVNR
ncbi:MAG: serine hydrolase domain-containing protein [Candidatus Marinimicrobia bacterium]|nr:serine hydrolase domain-containing protein [Candidatus Neomarinimicrobiota bacterium]